MPSLQTSRRDVGRTSSLDSDLAQSITPGTEADEDPAALADCTGLADPPEPTDGLLAAELAELAELAAEEAEVRVADVPELVEWHAVSRVGPRIAQTASAAWKDRIMYLTTPRTRKRLHRNFLSGRAGNYPEKAGQKEGWCPEFGNSPCGATIRME